MWTLAWTAVKGFVGSYSSWLIGAAVLVAVGAVAYLGYNYATALNRLEAVEQQACNLATQLTTTNEQLRQHNATVQELTKARAADAKTFANLRAQVARFSNQPMTTNDETTVDPQYPAALVSVRNAAKQALGNM